MSLVVQVNYTVRPGHFAVEHTQVRYIRFGPLTSPIRFDGCDQLIAAIRSIFPSWNIREIPAHEASSPAIKFKKRDGRYFWQSRHFPPPPEWERRKRYFNIKDTAADFHFVFFDWFMSEQPEAFQIHSAAVEIGGKLVVFPSAKRAGKSSLTAALARRGHRVFCDDVLILDLKHYEALSLGIMPRLRVPLPNNMSSEERDFISRHTGLSSKSSIYLKIVEPMMADYGSRATIDAIVMLDRHEQQTEAGLRPAGQANTLARLITQNSAGEHSPTLIFDTLLDIVRNVELHHLNYTTLAEAGDVLEEHFAKRP